MAKIKIIISTGNHKGDLPGSMLLRWLTRCEYSHCEIMYDNYIVGARTHGVERYPLETLAIKHDIGTLECSDEQKTLFDNFIESQIGKSYDYRSYLGFIFNKKTMEDQDKWFCSELILEGLSRAGIKLFNGDCIKPWNIMPRDLHMSNSIAYGEDCCD